MDPIIISYTPGRCCCGKYKELSNNEDVIHNDMVHQVLGPPGNFCGWKDNHTIVRLEKDIEKLKDKIEELESDPDGRDMIYKSNIKLIGVNRKLVERLFQLGEMNNPPCFNCGYNGEGYFNPKHHLCAEQHHKLFQGVKEDEDTPLDEAIKEIVNVNGLMSWDELADKVLVLSEELDTMKATMDAWNPCGHSPFESIVCSKCGYPWHHLSDKLAALEKKIKNEGELL